MTKKIFCLRLKHCFVHTLCVARRVYPAYSLSLWKGWNEIQVEHH
jgi:hypothetical protein